uniref:Translation initiation factor IF-2 n=1 Tax=Angiostrongylus cantonensis TaxID=6313 RepID=A0A0K0CZ41_ANGCA
MADKSAFVPIEAVTDRKSSAEIEADIDAELFGKKADSKSPAKQKSDTSVKKTTPPPPPPPPQEPPKPAVGKYQYKKSTTYQKTYAYARK